MGSYWSAPYFSKKVVQAEPAVKQESTEQKKVAAMETMVSSVITSNADAFVELSDKRPLSPICEVDEPKEDPLWKGVHQTKLTLVLQDIASWTPKKKTKTNQKAEPKEEPKAEPKEEPKEEPKAKPKEEPKAKPKEEPKAEPKVEPKEEPKAELKLEEEKAVHQEKAKLLLRDILNREGKRMRLLVDAEPLKTEAVLPSVAPVEVTSDIAPLAIPSSAPFTEPSAASSTEPSARIPEFRNNFNSASHAIKKFNKKHRKN